jgi:hypothetical protein
MKRGCHVEVHPTCRRHVVYLIGSFLGIENGLSQISKTHSDLANCEQLTTSDSNETTLAPLARVSITVHANELVTGDLLDRLEAPSVQHKMGGLCLSSCLARKDDGDCMAGVLREQLTILKHVLPNMSVLVKLDISANMLYGPDGDILAQGLNGNSVLIDLNLSGNVFGIHDSEGDPFEPTELIDCIGTLTRLQYLNVSSCALWSKACVHLFTKLQGNNVLCDLDISGNNLGQQYTRSRCPRVDAQSLLTSEIFAKSVRCCRL